MPAQTATVASIVMAAGRGSRMKGYAGNKALLPLVPGTSLFGGERPMLLHILEQLPEGPKCIIVHHRKEEVMDATRNYRVSYGEQPVLNGTGGAVLAARDFIEGMDCPRVLITMGDVPFVKPETYRRMAGELESHHLMVLGFCPCDKKQYGVIEIEDGCVRKITEWKYWKDYPEKVRQCLSVCNAGIYAVRTPELIRYLDVMAHRPQRVLKEIDGNQVAFDEYFLTDLVEYMVTDGLAVGCLLAENDEETMGVDDPFALERAQSIYRAASRAA